MTPAQRVALMIGVVILIVLFLVPPWYAVQHHQSRRIWGPDFDWSTVPARTEYEPGGHHLVLAPPANTYEDFYTVHYRIDKDRLALEALLVIALTGGAYVALGFWRRK